MSKKKSLAIAERTYEIKGDQNELVRFIILHPQAHSEGFVARVLVRYGDTEKEYEGVLCTDSFAAVEAAIKLVRHLIERMHNHNSGNAVFLDGKRSVAWL